MVTHFVQSHAERVEFTFHIPLVRYAAIAPGAGPGR